MTTAGQGTSTNLAKFQSLLRELFQFDCADLDFGIYRIMNHKRDAVERFIAEQLPEFVTAELDRGPLAHQAQAATKLARARQELIELADSMGEAAFDVHGELTERYKTVPASKDYREAQYRATDSSRSRDAVEAAIYNHLFSFFSSHYEDGDFISKRRYSRNRHYAIPYNGEEVYLHWANRDQYYVKTDEHFRNYDWKAPNGITVHFRLRNADVEQNNVKGNRRFFIPLVSQMECDAGSSSLTIPFEYRPLSPSEGVAYGKTRQQDKIVEQATSVIPQQLRDHDQALAALAGDADNPVSRLEHHLRRYVRRNNSDFFIHKDLAGFLNRELDFYLKNEVLNLDNLAVAGWELSEGWFQQMRLTKAVGSKIIDFLAQIEDFQKMLWEKRKFVTEAQYCITLGNIEATFYPDILSNDSQWDEWRDLFSVDGSDRSEGFLSSHPTLVLDTRHFQAGVVDRLLASFGNLDDYTDGLLVHAENWQALHLLEERYRGAIRCTYVDPPFNTDDSQFVFKDTYRNSTWLSLLHDRLQMGKRLCTDDGTCYLHLDHNSNFYGRMLTDRVFGADCLLNEVTWRIGWVSGYKTAAARYVRNHETIFVCGHRPQPYFNKDKARIPYQAFDEKTVAKEIAGIKAAWGLEDSGPLQLKLVFKDAHGNVYKTGLSEGPGRYNIEDTWNSNEYEELHSNKIKRNAAEYTPNGSEITQKPEQLLRRAIEVSSEKGDIVLDYFAGSGTTPAVAMKLGRRFLAIEMGQYFDTDMLWRLKQVLFGKEVGISRQTQYKGGGMFKYIRLESYEDALDSIQFEDPAGQLRLAEPSEEYLLKYMLPWETRDSDTLLNAARLASPFSYRLRIHANGVKRERTVDLPETFNYLLGLKVRKRQVFDDDGRRYLVFQGETRDAPGRHVAIIWRETENWTDADFARDRDFVVEHNLTGDADTVYINGDSAIPGARPIEPMFKARMFASVKA